MPLEYMMGDAGAVRAGMLSWLRAALDAPGEGAAVLLVPDQFTLQAEMDALNELNLPGSFRMQVLSPRRLYRRVFEQAGGPMEVRVDEQGCVMLMYAAAKRLKKKLRWYRGAVDRPGFAERAVSQVGLFKQAGLDPEALALMAQEHEGALQSKLHDLALLFSAYEGALEGRFMDGEDEAARAALRVMDAPFLAGSRVMAYGFDLITPTLARTLVALCGAAESVGVAMVMNVEDGARDHHLFAPIRRSLNRLSARAREAGICVTNVRLAPASTGAPGALRHLGRELFCAPQEVFEGRVSDVRLALLANPQEEAEFAAALVRHLARVRQWRYRDFAVACMNDDEATMGALKRAFSLYGVPLFLSSGRPADRHPLASCLLSALRAVTTGFRTLDMALFIRSGFSPLSPDEADQMINRAQARALRGRAWLRPFACADEGEDALEPVRQRLMAPLEALMRRAKEARDTRELLAAIYMLLEDLGAWEALEQERRVLTAEGMAVWAMEGAQVWNRVLEALDQMAQLLDGERLTLKDACEMLRRALSAAIVKALPQSADAVEGGSLDHLKGKPVKALLLVGASDAGAERARNLLGEEEIERISAGRDMEMGMSDEERMRMRRIGFKSLIALTEKMLLVSRPQSDASGRATQAGTLMNEIARLLGQTTVRGGVTADENMVRLRLEQADAALCRVPGLLRAGAPCARAALEALEGMPKMKTSLAAMRASFAHKVYSETLPEALGRAVCGPMSSVSASRLERFAACPFRHFAHYAIRPEVFRPFELSPRDAGTFYHDALEKFVRGSGEELSALTAAEGARRMDEITTALIEKVLASRAGDSALAAAEGERMRGVARRAASIIVRQFEDSRFRPISIEADISSGDVRVPLDEAAALGGRIDRVDVWDAGDQGRFVRVIDYKTGGRTVSLQEIYYGLQLQLIVYLASALGQMGGKAAGVFYFDVSDPLMDTEERDAQAIEAEREKRLRLDGLIVRDEMVVRAMAASPERAVNVAFNKDGTLRATDKVIEPGDFDLLIDHALSCARAMLKAMRAGQTDIAPAQISGKSACRFCEYKTVCQYDEALPGAAPRRLAKLSSKQVLETLREDASR